MTVQPEPEHLSAEDRARRIKVLLFDVDGVLTDGQLFFIPQTGPDGAQHGVEVKGFTAHDGLGITLARLGGLRVGLITKRESATVAVRARDLKLEFVYQGQAHKLRPRRRSRRRPESPWKKSPTSATT